MNRQQRRAQQAIKRSPAKAKQELGPKPTKLGKSITLKSSRNRLSVK